MYNLLTEPLIRMDTTADSGVPATLPEIYAALIADKVDAFPALRPHQRHAWHAFLVQLGALALHRAGRSEPPAEAAEWCELISGLTPDYPDDEPWQLIVEDITKPAFMQPPASAPDKLAEFKSAVETPDELDMLVTSKNHDLKAAVAARAKADDWIFALISLQTMGGYSAAGSKARYYNISRMDGVSASRLAYSLTPSAELGRHVRRDIEALLEFREQLLEEEYPEYSRDGGIQLVWTKCWDGDKSLLISELDIFYIEICRRIRLHFETNGNIYGKRVGSQVARIDAKASRGNTGDPWAPIDRTGKQESSLRLTSGGFKFNQVANCLDPSKYRLPPLFKLTPSEQMSPTEMFLVARGIVSYPKIQRTVTEGYDERIIPLRSKVIAVFGRAGGPERLGDVSRTRVERAGIVQKILRESIAVFVAGGERDLKKLTSEHYSIATSWIDRLDSIIERTFFEDLQDEFEVDEKDARERIHNAWLRGVVDAAEQILRDAANSLPCPSMQRFRALVNAEDHFDARKRGPKGLRFLFVKAKQDDKECPSNDQARAED